MRTNILWHIYLYMLTLGVLWWYIQRSPCSGCYCVTSKQFWFHGWRYWHGRNICWNFFQCHKKWENVLGEEGVLNKFCIQGGPPQGSFHRYSTDKWYSFHLPTLEKFPIVAIKIELIKLDAINVHIIID